MVEKIQVALQSESIFQPASKAAPLEDSANPYLLPVHDLAIAPPEIPLNRLKVAMPIRYVSAIAFRLAQRPEIGKAPLEIAHAIAEQLDHLISAAQTSENSEAPDQTCRQIWQNFAVQTAEPGWIYLQLSDRGVAIWLQSLISTQMPLSDSTSLSSSTALSLDPSKQAVINSVLNIRNSTRIFPLLHTHARCCSLLRLANQTGIIHLDRLDATGSLIFPWLNPESAQLCCQHLAEQQLISQLVNTLDQLSPLKQRDRKLAEALSQDFQSFHAACRIWGEVERTDLPLAQTRLGLIWIVQTVMRSLLAELGIDAPIEL